MELNHFIFVDESCPCCEGKKCANHAALSLEQRKQNQSASTILALYTRKRFRKAKTTHVLWYKTCKNAFSSLVIFFWSNLSIDEYTVTKKSSQKKNQRLLSGTWDIFQQPTKKARHFCLWQIATEASFLNLFLSKKYLEFGSGAAPKRGGILL